MATIYRFIVESGGTGGGGTKSGTGSAKSKGVKKPKVPKEKPTTGVEFNRYQRITTTLGNKMTNGMYSPTLRTGKAILNTTQGFANGEIPILGMLVIAQAIARIVGYYIDIERDKAQRLNSADIKKLEVGQRQLYGNVEVSKNILNGRINIKDND